MDSFGMIFNKSPAKIAVTKGTFFNVSEEFGSFDFPGDGKNLWDEKSK
jgi:hypothetical protein